MSATDRSTEAACSVVIPAHNAADTLGDQLDALAGQVGAPELEIIVVANRCTDDTIELVERCRRSDTYPHQLRVIRADDRPSVNYARNRGVAAAAHSMILACDADDIVWPEWARELHHSLLTADIVAGATVRWNPNDYPDPTTMTELDSGAPDDVRYEFLPAVIGANHAFRKAIWAKIGGYDEAFANATDIDFAWRAQLAGGRYVGNDKARVYYRDRATVGGVFARQRAYGRADAQLYRKFRPHGMPKPRGLRRRPAVRYLHQLVTAYRLLTPAGRRVWIGHLGKNIGRLEGSWKNRVVYL